MEEINKYKLKTTTFTADLEGELDRDARTFLYTETAIYEVSTQDQNDGSYDKVYKCKVVGETQVKQEGKVVKGKSKRSQSKKLRQALWCINPEEEFYQKTMSKIISRIEDVVEYLS